MSKQTVITIIRPCVEWQAIVQEAKQTDSLALSSEFSLGTHAKQFIAYASKIENLPKLSPPATEEQMHSILARFALLDQDLTEHKEWPLFWQQQTIDNETQKQQLQNQVVAAYRLQVIRRCEFHQVKSHNKQQAALLAISEQEFLGSMNEYLYRYGTQACGEHLINDAQATLASQRDHLLTELSLWLKKGHLLPMIEWLRQSLDFLQWTWAYEILGNESSSKILAPLIEKLHAYEKKMNMMTKALENICQQALPGVLIQDFVRQEVVALVEQDIFKTTPEIGPVILVNYLNSPQVVRKIHEDIINTRVNSCLPHIHDIPVLQQEIRKITVYRVRRNVIAKLFRAILKKYNLTARENPIISREDEECLMALQQEYLHAMYRQLEKIDRKDVAAFFDDLKIDLVLKPLPRTNRFGQKIDLAQKEIDYLMANYVVPTRDPLQEGVALCDIDCPIEMDVLGEMSQQLMQASGQFEERQGANVVMAELEQTYRNIQSPNFKVLTQWEDYLYHQQYDLLKEYFVNERDCQNRLQALNTLYEHLKIHGLAKLPWTEVMFNSQAKYIRSLVKWMKTVYIATLFEMVTSAAIHSDRDKYVFYCHQLVPSLNTALGWELFCHRRSARKVMGVLQLLLRRMDQQYRQ